MYSFLTFIKRGVIIPQLYLSWQKFNCYKTVNMKLFFSFFFLLNLSGCNFDKANPDEGVGHLSIKSTSDTVKQANNKPRYTANTRLNIQDSLFLLKFKSISVPFADTSFLYSKNEIEKKEVEQFLCMKNNGCVYDPTKFSYNYGVKFRQDNLILFIYNKNNWGGEESLDYFEDILGVYDLKTRRITHHPLVKNQDSYWGHFFIEKPESIRIENIDLNTKGVIPIDKTEFDGLIEVIELKTLSNGGIVEIKRNKSSKIIKFDKNRRKFIY